MPPGLAAATGERGTALGAILLRPCVPRSGRQLSMPTLRIPQSQTPPRSRSWRRQRRDYAVDVPRHDGSVTTDWYSCVEGVDAVRSEFESP